MSDVIEIEDEALTNENKEDDDMGSVNHSVVQGRIAGLLFNDGRFTVMPELSLDISKIDPSQFGIKAKNELKPDICLYPNSVGGRKRDILRMPEKPLLIIEVISPEQGIREILAKFDAYFALGVKSCWLVLPEIKTITVYSQPDSFTNFDHNDREIVDEVMDIRLQISQIFNW
jgi:Uma2 family endonuclease